MVPKRAIDYIAKPQISGMTDSLLGHWSGLAKRLPKYCRLTIGFGCSLEVEVKSFAEDTRHFIQIEGAEDLNWI